MALLSRLFARQRPVPSPVPRQEPVLARALPAPRLGGGGRAWLAAAPSRLLADLPGGAAQAPNREIRASLAVLRARSRWLAQNDGYSKGFLRMLRRNVVGPTGFTLQMRVPDDRDPKKQDEDANNRIEAAWADWSGVNSCEVTGRMSFAALCQAAMVGVARDGEAIIRVVRGQRFNSVGIALQLLDPSQLDEGLNVPYGAGRVIGYRMPAANAIRMGVEIDEYGRPVAYHLRTVVPNDDCWRNGTNVYQRVPAADIFHLFVTDWPGQVRGIPWLEAGIRALAMLDGYTEAELVAARIGASKMGFYKLAEGASADDLPAELQSDARLVQEAEAGTFEMLPAGIDLQTYDPQHPTQAFKDFCSGILRHAAAGTGISYNAFANDAGGLNYSALRATALDDRDEYRTVQNWMVGSLPRPFFADWLREALLAGVTALPPGKFWKFNAPRFVPRGWQWVDPQNEMAAAREAVALGIASRQRIAAEQGNDFEEIAADLRAEQALLDGINPPAAPNKAPAPGATTNAP